MCEGSTPAAARSVAPPMRSARPVKGAGFSPAAAAAERTSRVMSWVRRGRPCEPRNSGVERRSAAGVGSSVEEARDGCERVRARSVAGGDDDRHGFCGGPLLEGRDVDDRVRLLAADERDVGAAQGQLPGLKGHPDV